MSSGNVWQESATGAQADCRRRPVAMTRTGALLRATNSVYDTGPRLDDNTTDLETTLGNSHPEELLQTFAQNLFVRENRRSRKTIHFLHIISAGGQSDGASLEDNFMLPAGGL